MTLAEHFARLVVRARFIVVAAWIAVAVSAAIYLPTLREAQSASFGDLVPNQAAAIDAELRSKQLFDLPLLSRTVVVQRDPRGLSPAEQRDAAGRALELNRGAYPGLTGIAGALPVTNVLGVPPFSRERSTTALSYLFYPPEIGQFGQTGLAERFVERHVAPTEEGFVGVTGALPARVAQYEAIQEKLPLIELATVALISAIVALHFRAAGAPLANLATVAISYVTSIRLLGAIGQRLGVSVPSEIEPVLVALLLGVVTDYSIFFLARVLAVFLRALVAPLYLLAASALALAAALGLTTYLFQDVLGYGEITYYVPFASAVLLVALGSD